ncbi:MAG TPA: methyltransferase domain-containing protein [Gaiellaceae bacterium]|nr:methyltransferase domain-containing protein [Gaiellaceae bacterium]
MVPGDRALDIGCGPGVLLDELARRVGTDGVAGVDPSEPFVAAARAAVPNADVRLAPAEQLPFDTDAFDVALSQLVVNFMSDAEAGVGQMRRVARRAVTSCVWDYAGEMTMLRAFWDAALELDADAPDEAAARCRRALRQLRRLLVAVHAGIAPSGAYCASLDEKQQTALQEACFRRLGSPRGSFSLSARAWFVTGSTL